MLQFLLSRVWPVQSLPPCFGRGLVHPRKRSWEPVPQDLVHEVHPLHFDQPPCTKLQQEEIEHQQNVPKLIQSKLQYSRWWIRKNGKYLKELYRTCGYTLLSVVKSLFLLFIVDIHHVTNLVHPFLKTYSFNHHVSHFTFNLTRIRKCHVTQLLFRTKESWDILKDEETRVTKSRLASGLHFVGVRIKASSIG